MKTILIFAAIITIIIAAGTMLPDVEAQQTGSKRTNLQKNDLSIPGREVVQVRVDFDPGYLAPPHTHPGEEIVYVIEGTLEYKVEGRQPVTLKTGEVLFIPAGAVHSAKNVGTDNAAELATYIVEKGKPLLALSKAAGSK